MNDKKLADGCKSGDRGAMKILYERYYSRMLGVCQRYAYNFADAEDFVQDGFIKIFKDIRSYKGTGSLEGWIRRVMINNVLMHLRKKKREYASDTLETTADDTREDYHKDIENESGFLPPEAFDITQKEVIEMIQTLPDGYRKVLNLHIVDGFKHREIAVMLSISEGTSKSQLNRARKIMRKKLTEYIQQKKIINIKQKF